MTEQTLDFPISTRPPLDFSNGVVVDNFAGGGGASTGIEQALGRPVDCALNHDAAAIAVHKANHPQTRHFCQSIYSADPLEVTGGRPVLLGWFSPDCKHFSKAKGGKPVEKNIRDLANVVIHWVERIGHANIKMFMLENVEEFRDWGPLIETEKGMMPDPARKGEDFKRWCKALRKAGATAIEWRELRACDYGAPTIRKRLFVIIRFDGEPIVWPDATHAHPKSEAATSGRLKPWRTAAEIIDWSIPCPSIFERKKPLKEATLRRIAAGIMRYVVNAATPFIVPLTHHGSASRSYSVDDPLVTVTGAHRGELAVVSPLVVPITHTQNGGAGRSVADPLATITTAKGGELALATATLVQTGYGEREGQAPRALDIAKPLGTVVAGGQKHAAVVASLVAPHVTKFRANSVGHAADEPLHTITANSYIKRAGGCAPLGLVEARLAPVIDSQYGNSQGAAADKPLPTITSDGGGKQAAVVATLLGCGGRAGQSRPRGADEPVATVTAKADVCVAEARLAHAEEVVAFLAQHNGGNVGREAEEPVSTLTQSGSQQQLVTSHLVKLRGTCADGQPVNEPAPTIMAGGFHIGEVRAFLLKYYGADQDPRLDEPLHTVTTKDRFAAVTVMIGGEPYVIADIGMRMLTVDELKLAQGFPPDYDMLPVCEYATESGAKKFGPLPKSQGVAKVGNSVSPYMSRALVAANLPDYTPMREVAE